MCRLSAFFGAPICAADLVTRPSRSIITQSFDARERMTGDASTPAYLNGDGFGLGWYSIQDDDPIPCIYKQARPAWNDPNLSSIAEKLYTRLLFAHVRAASAGLDVSESTCHPFRYGRYLFMHNGGLGGFPTLRRHLLTLLKPAPFDFAVTHGCSDTALCFALFLDLLGDDSARELQTADTLRMCLEKTIGIIEDAQLKHGIKEVSLLNFVVSDGHSLIATRYVINIADPIHSQPASLYYAAGNSYQSDGSAPGNYVMKHTDRRNTLTIVSSEPLTESRADWVSVPRNFCIVVTQSMHVLLSAIRPSPVSKADDVISRILATLSTSKNIDSISTSSLSSSLRRPNGASKWTSSNNIRDGSSSTSLVRMGGSRGLSNKSSSNLQTVFCSVGAAVRTSITIPDATVLCCTVLDSLFCSGTNNGDIHVWNMELNRKHCVLSTECNAIQAILGYSDTQYLVCGTSVSTVLIFRLSEDGTFHRVLDVCCGGMGNILSLTKVGRSLFAGFSDAGLRCVLPDLLADVERLVSAPDTASDAKLPPNAQEEGYDNSICSSDNGMKRRNGVPLVNVRDVGHNFPVHSSTVVHKGFVLSLAPFKDGKFLCSGCGDGILRVWNVHDGECVQSRNDHAGAILALAIYEVSKGTMLFSGSRDCSVKVWLWDRDAGFICKRTLRKHRDEIVFLATAGSKLVSGSADGAVYVWCAETLHLICQYRDNGLKAGGVSARYNNLFTATNADGIQIRDIISTERKLIQRDAAEENGHHAHELNGRDVSNGSSLHADFLVAEQAFMKGTSNRNANNGNITPGVSNGNIRVLENNTKSTDAIVSEKDDDSDDMDTLASGVEMDQVLAPPMAPHIDNGTTQTLPPGGSDDKRDSSSLSNGEWSDDLGGHSANCGHSCHSAAVQVRINEARGSSVGIPAGVSDGDISELSDEQVLRAVDESRNGILPHVVERRLIEDALSNFISYATVANSSQHRESCWEGARCIGRFLEAMGASVKYVNTSARGGAPDDIPSNFTKKEARAYAAACDTNPIVLARFAAPNPRAETITFYGHYDVMPAMDLSQWATDPWQMKGIDGYLYGRGTTDNKGPIIATIFAVKKLVEENANGLGVNVVLVLQGEGEASNAGFKQCVLSHVHWFERTCLILTSNSTWLGENRPCLTYGFRGIVDLRVTITGGTKNLHSGVDGGAVFEPINDLITLLGTLVDASGVVCVPGFYDDVRPLSDAERARFATVEFDLDEYRRTTGVQRFTTDAAVDVLESRWRKPSVSITCVETSNTAAFFSVVPQRASAKISIRFVPDQDPLKIKRAVDAHLHHELRKRRSPNALQVDCVNRGDWWLRDPSGPEFQVAARAVREVWGVDPAYVCEGGSMPLFTFLAETLRAPLVQVPLGQSSDGAHLPNERIRALNLFRGKEVMQRIIAEYSNSNKAK